MLLPDVLVQSLESIKRGELTVRFDLQHFERLVRQLTRASNTLAIGILVAGLVVASALVLRAGSTSLAYGGFAISFVLLQWLFWNMSRRA
jgi:ubiquinone biosynthesis protein